MESWGRLVDCFWLPKHGAEKLIESTRGKLNVKAYNWNDWSHVACFLVFTRPFSKLTSAKFQTFTYNSIMVWSRYMKFWQQFEIHKLFVCAKFQGNEFRNFRFRTRKLLQKFGVKSDHIQKRLKYDKKYFTWLYVVRYLSIPTYTFSGIEFFSFSIFCFLNFVHSSFPKPHNIDI